MKGRLHGKEPGNHGVGINKKFQEAINSRSWNLIFFTNRTTMV
jgi:hypothetical protein